MSTFNKVTFEVIGLIDANIPTESGNVYTMDCLQQVVMQINANPGKITLQEMHVAEREKKGIAMHEPMQSRTMAVITAARINGDSLDLVCETKPTRDGKKLGGILGSLGIGAITCIPVGFGDTVSVGALNEVRNYLLKYVAVEPNLT